jgi:iron complex outermembrane receptor protein
VEVKLKISKKIFLLSFLLLSEWGFLFASFWEEESYLGDLGTVVITGTRIPQPASHILRNVTIIDGDEINSSPVYSAIELLRYAPGVDLQERGPDGVQADVGLRGANFHQVLILLDGVRMNDPQTAHHNLDLPINLEDLERIEILHGHGSSVYGADAFGGVVNFITKAPQDFRIGLQAFAGGNGTRGGTFSFSDCFGDFATLFSLGGKMSDGYRFDTDFKHFSFFSNSKLDTSQASIGLSFGYLQKEFGANDFYGDWPSREWTNTILGSISVRTEKWKNLVVESRIYYRQHDDKFIGDVTDPDSYVNYHTTFLYGGEVQLRTQWERMGEFVLGTELAKEELASSRLGDHSNLRGAVYAEYGVSLGRRFTLNPGIRIDQHSEWGWRSSPAMNIGYFPSRKMRLHYSLGRSFRAPDYTELYYWSPKNVGNPRLVVEQAWSHELGGDFELNTWLCSRTALFFRNGRNLIDWVRRDSLSPWEAVKIGKVYTYGVESLLEVALKSSACLSLGYTFLKSESEELENYVSKYVLNHPQHQASLGFGFPVLWGIRQNLKGTYKQHSHKRGYFILDGRLSKTLGQLEFHLGATNLLDISYEEVPGVPMPRSSFDCGIKLEF